VTKPAAFRGTYSDWRLVKTRAVVQVIFEVPLADADAAYEVLGGMPVHGNERWFGIAAIKSTAEEASPAPRQELASPTPDGAKRMDWREVQPAAQAGIRCEDPVFKAFMDEVHGLAEWNGFTTAEAVRSFCGVKSRSELSTNHKARVLWHQLDSEFIAWKAVEHA